MPSSVTARASSPASAVSIPAGSIPAGLLVGTLLALSLAPVALVDIPAMVDYPNHLARMSILARAGTPDANPFYEPAWGFYPNLAMDLIVPPLARLIGVVSATKLFYLLSQVLIVSGSMALSWTVRRSFLGAGITACLCLYAVPLGWGFVNFEFGLGLALWCIAARLRLARGAAGPRIALHALAVTALYASHLFGLGAYGFVVGVWELRRAIVERRGWPALAASLLELAAPVLVLCAVAALLAGPQAAGPVTPNRWEFLHKLEWLCGLNGQARGLSHGLTFCLAMVGYAALRNGCIRFVDAGAWIAGAFALLYGAMPFGIRDTSFVDVRVLVTAALVLPAFMTVTIRSETWRRRAMAAIGLVALANLAGTAWMQAHHGADYGAMIASFRQLSPHARVLVAGYEGAGDPPDEHVDDPLNHAPVLAAHFADAFVPTLFTYRGQQPVRAVAAAAALPADAPVTTPMLAAIAANEPAPDAPSFARSWQTDFDYLYVLRQTGPNPLPGLIDPVTAGPSFVLYRIRPPLRAGLS